MIANKIYEPSYISLHMALQYYGLIPEGVFTMTSISTKKTNEFTTPVGNFIYKKIRKDLMFGYKIIKINKLLYFKIAEIEKAILDFFYLNPHIYTENDFYELRIDCYELVKQRDEKKLERYLKTFNKKKLAETIHNFISYVKKMLSLEDIKEHYPPLVRDMPRHLLREYLQYKILQHIFDNKYANKLCFI